MLFKYCRIIKFMLGVKVRTQRNIENVLKRPKAEK